MSSIDTACIEAAELISEADSLLVTAGAGIGIDSGWRETSPYRWGHWRALPALPMSCRK